MRDKIFLIESNGNDEANCILKELEEKLKQRKFDLFNATRNPAFNLTFPKDFFQRNSQLKFAIGIFLEYLASAYISDKYDCFAIGWRPNKHRKNAKFGMDNILISREKNKIIILESKSSYSNFNQRLKQGFESLFIQEISSGTFANVKEHIDLAINDLWTIQNLEQNLHQQLNELFFEQLKNIYSKFIELDSDDEQKNVIVKDNKKIYYIEDSLYKNCLNVLVFFSNKIIDWENVEKLAQKYINNLLNPELEINIISPVDKTIYEIEDNHLNNFYQNLEAFFNE
ncbi:hypothetical protein [Spiroplasma cantharicola]|uniref:Uncharacterized protein n=1 Tax=Spiroplasma cantharicola TaxID=362837 RepID=A0A0M3SJE3_9MOLU|nr:hypothetical protein [Spiroplasma cantharicola]ALD66584.1 hypothetical protein SCANT_v1c06780 [Spiroplasma cantharicola]